MLTIESREFIARSPALIAGKIVRGLTIDQLYNFLIL